MSIKDVYSSAAASVKTSYTSLRRREYWEPFLLTLMLLAVLIPIWMFTGLFPWVQNPYDTYAIQAQSWLNGRLDVDFYEHLELAYYQGHYYVSFPPFPSYVMLPLLLLFKSGMDGWLQLLCTLLGLWYAYYLTCTFTYDRERRLLFPLLLCIGSNLLPHAASNGWVWFLAQNMSFALTMMSFYHGVKGHTGRCLFFWGAAVGCRPFQIVYLPLLLYMLRTSAPYAGQPIGAVLRKNIIKTVPCLILAISYMLLNYARFDSVTEFGHNYLEEFQSYEHGQFHWSYLSENLKSLFRLPSYENSRLIFPAFNGVAVWLVSPIFAVYLVYWVRALIRKSCRIFPAVIIPVLLTVHLLFLCSHATMGGYHFGNRYTNDLLPCVYLGLLFSLGEKALLERLLYSVTAFGAAINTLGAIAYYLNLL